MNEQEELKREHDYHWDSFIQTRDFKHFEAAKACAYKIIKYENDMRAYVYSPDLRLMYFPDWRIL